MKLADARIGYAGYSRDFSAPGDRRRFVAYARARGLDFEYAEIGGDYDLAYVTYSGDLPGWIARKLRQRSALKLVFELVDAYFTETGLVRRYLKGTARRALGTDSRLSMDVRRTLMRACEVADAVICSTEEQRETICRYNPNVFISFDYFGDELGEPKRDYSRSEKLRLAWEGQSTTLPNLQVIREPLNDLGDKIELHIVSDPRIHRYFGRFGGYASVDALEGIECPVVYHPWDRATFSDLITSCDAAVIPIDQSNPLWWGKPENKLVLLWQLGMPVLVSSTPVYGRVMDAANINMNCASSGEWRTAIERLFVAPPSELERVGTQARRFADEAYSRDAFIDCFDRALASVGIR
jgi:hypothetical protein